MWCIFLSPLLCRSVVYHTKYSIPQEHICVEEWTRFIFLYVVFCSVSFMVLCVVSVPYWYVCSMCFMVICVFYSDMFVHFLQCTFQKVVYVCIVLKCVFHTDLFVCFLMMRVYTVQCVFHGDVYRVCFIIMCTVCVSWWWALPALARTKVEATLANIALSALL